MRVSNSSVARPWKLEQKHFRAGFEADQLVEIAAKKASQMKQCKSWIRKNTSAKLRGSFEVPRESRACANWIKTMWFFGAQNEGKGSKRGPFFIIVLIKFPWPWDLRDLPRDLSRSLPWSVFCSNFQGLATRVRAFLDQASPRLQALDSFINMQGKYVMIFSWSRQVVKGPVWVRFLAPETHMNLDTEVRGPYCQLGLGLCVDAFLYWNSAAEDGIQPLDV